MVSTDPQMQTVARSKTPSARALIEQHDKILKIWEASVRKNIPTARDLPHPLIIDTVPAFLKNLAEALSEEHVRKPSDTSNVSQEHGGERARLSRYFPDHLILEYLLLRDAIFEVLDETVKLVERDRLIIQKTFDVAICQSMVAFFLVHSKIREKFMASLSHDLRNPIGACRMAGELIAVTLNDKNWQEGVDGIRDLARKVIKNAKRADRMIQDLLDATVIQMGDTMQLDVKEHEILSIVREALADMNREDVTRIRIEGAPQWGYWDGDSLRRVIENLLSNAFKYGDAGSPVTIQIDASNGRLILRVHNYGPPIPVEEREQLFQAFRRAESARASGKKGWGIGLALVRGVAEAHGGSVTIESSAKLGTTFTFDVPIDARPYLNSPTTQ